MFCDYCKEVTVDKLLDLNESATREHDEQNDFPELLYLAHHPSFDSLLLQMQAANYAKPFDGSFCTPEQWLRFSRGRKIT